MNYNSEVGYYHDSDSSREDGIPAQHDPVPGAQSLDGSPTFCLAVWCLEPGLRLPNRRSQLELQELPFTNTLNPKP